MTRSRPGGSGIGCACPRATRAAVQSATRASNRSSIAALPCGNCRSRTSMPSAYRDNSARRGFRSLRDSRIARYCDLLFGGAKRLARKAGSFMPSYRNAVVPSVGQVRVKPIGYRRVWGIKWWWPYFQGSSFGLDVEVTSRTPYRFGAQLRSDRGDKYDLCETQAYGPGRRTIPLRYPSTAILPSGQSKAIMVFITEDSGGGAHVDEFIGARFDAWDQDQAITGRLLPFILGVIITLVTTLLTLRATKGDH